jgi:formamidopyrimidine-DNA glycosylase
MPELPEVESVRRLLERVLKGHKIVSVEATSDKIVWGPHEPKEVAEVLKGAKVKSAGRKGKFFWLELDRRPWLCGHFGMSGWIREVGGRESRLKEHGNAPLTDEEGRPKFLKLLIEADNGKRIAYTDGRRLGRLWLCDDPLEDKRITKLGPDALLEMPSEKTFFELIHKRNAPIKAVLMDQAMISGVGNWVADEVLYHARIAPKRLGSSIKPAESKKLRQSIIDVLKTAVKVDAAFDRFPENWLFHHRWGGKRGRQQIGGKKIVRETVGGRTTAWVPQLQK